MIFSIQLDAAIFGRDFKWLITSGLVLLHAVDLINTVSLCWYLRAGKTGVLRYTHVSPHPILQP